MLENFSSDAVEQAYPSGPFGDELYSRNGNTPEALPKSNSDTTEQAADKNSAKGLEKPGNDIVNASTGKAQAAKLDSDLSKFANSTVYSNDANMSRLQKLVETFNGSSEKQQAVEALTVPTLEIRKTLKTAINRDLYQLIDLEVKQPELLPLKLDFVAKVDKLSGAISTLPQEWQEEYAKLFRNSWVNRKLGDSLERNEIDVHDDLLNLVKNMDQNHQKHGDLVSLYDDQQAANEKLEAEKTPQIKALEKQYWREVFLDYDAFQVISKAHERSKIAF